MTPTPTLASDDPLLHALMSGPLGIAVVDVDFRYTHFNAALAAMNNSDPTDAIGRTVREVVPHLADQLEPALRAVVTTRQARHNFEVFGFGPDAGRIWLEHLQPLCTEDGHLIGVVFIIEEITARHYELERNVATRIEAFERLDMALEAVDIGLWDWDMISGQLRWSPQQERLYGLEPGSFKGRIEDFLSMLHPDELQTATAVQEALQRGETVRRQIRIRRADGTQRIMLSISRGVVNEASKLVRVIGSSLDITDQVRVETAFRASERRYRALVQASTQFVWRRSKTGTELESMKWWSDLTGQPIEAVNSDEWLEAIHPDDRAHTEQAWKEAFSTGQIYETEYRLRRHDGSYVNLAVRGVPLHDEDGRVEEWIGTFTDITAERAATRRLLEINEAQSRFISDAAHELRAPLTSIQGNLSLLAQYPHMSLSDRLEAAAESEQEAGRMGRLIKDLLALSRGEARQQGMVQSLALDGVVIEVWRTVQALSKNHHFELLPIQQVKVDGDPDGLKQVLLALLENAIRYTPEGERIELGLKRLPDGAEICVSDAGYGIAQIDLPHVFERFYRADQARSRSDETGGTGLGLTIAKLIVERHGGTIHLESEEGQGTKAIVWLPYAQ